MDDAALSHDAAGITRHIELHFHARHRRQLPFLADLAAKVEVVHAGGADVPAGLSNLLRRMFGELEVHMMKEELILFPAMRTCRAIGIDDQIAMMRSEHDEQDRDVAEIRRITGGPTLPEGACRSWTALYQGLEEFITDLADHMRLENEVLFPMFEATSAPGYRDAASRA